MKPLIGLTPTPEIKEQEHGTFRLHTLNENYSRSVIAAGGIPVILPSNTIDIDELLDRLDGVIITGGGDVNPVEYGQDPHEKTDGIDAERDQFEQAVVRAALERDMPLLGICRGIQVLNVALGGTLRQDVADLVEDAAEHRQQSLGIHHEELFQTVTLAEGDHPLRHMAGSETLEINSFHHQCIGDLASSLQVMARSADGVIEAAYNPTVSFGIAVQWHPEMLQHAHSEHAALFRGLVEAASAYQTRITNREVVEQV